MKVTDYIPIVGCVTYCIRKRGHLDIDNPNISGPALENRLFLTAYNGLVMCATALAVANLEKLIQ